MRSCGDATHYAIDIMLIQIIVIDALHRRINALQRHLVHFVIVNLRLGIDLELAQRIK